jgi:hypothetical protein
MPPLKKFVFETKDKTATVTVYSYTFAGAVSQLFNIGCNPENFNLKN